MSVNEKLSKVIKCFYLYLQWKSIKFRRARTITSSHGFRGVCDIKRREHQSGFKTNNHFVRYVKDQK